MGNKDNIKNIITSKFKDKLWSDKELGEKRKLRYYKEVIDPIVANHNYISILMCTKKRMNISRIKTIFHDLWSKTRLCSIPKIPCHERICLLCESKRVEYEKYFLLDCTTLTHIHSHLKIIFPMTNILNLFSQKNYNDLQTLLSLTFYHKNTVLNNPN